MAVRRAVAGDAGAIARARSGGSRTTHRRRVPDARLDAVQREAGCAAAGRVPLANSTTQRDHFPSIGRSV
jgi:hypothetical protein